MYLTNTSKQTATKEIISYRGILNSSISASVLNMLLFEGFTFTQKQQNISFFLIIELCACDLVYEAWTEIHHSSMIYIFNKKCFHHKHADFFSNKRV